MANDGPATPPRSRKYGSLGRASAAGRVPLHRRGTSGKYEALEDLLREAGYKETRIFTPERPVQTSTLRGRVAGFFAGLVVGKDEEESPPASPPPPVQPPSVYASSQPCTSSTSSLGLPQQLAPRAGSLLRHIASESQLPPERPQSTPPHLAFQSNAHLANEAKQSWLQSVARTMLQGVPEPGAHPQRLLRTTSNQPYRRPQPPHLTRGRTSAQSALPWNSTTSLITTTSYRPSSTLATSSAALAPPSLARLGEQRSPRSQSQVCHTKVVVRSAPGSRAASHVRSKDHGMERSESAFNQVLSARAKGKDKERDELGAKRRRRRNKAEVVQVDVPVLARTRTEGDDVWDMPRGRDRCDSERTILVSRGRERSHTMQLPSPSPSPDRLHSSSHSSSPSSSLPPQVESESESSDDDDDAGIDLARLLVPPKRQNSIRSLRRHLIVSAGEVPPVPSLVLPKTREGEDESEAQLSRFGGKRRAELPNAWAR